MAWRMRTRGATTCTMETSSAKPRSSSTAAGSGSATATSRARAGLPGTARSPGPPRSCTERGKMPCRSDRSPGTRRSTPGAGRSKRPDGAASSPKLSATSWVSMSSRAAPSSSRLVARSPPWNTWRAIASSTARIEAAPRWTRIELRVGIGGSGSSVFAGQRGPMVNEMANARQRRWRPRQGASVSSAHGASTVVVTGVRAVPAGRVNRRIAAAPVVWSPTARVVPSRARPTCT